MISIFFSLGFQDTDAGGFVVECILCCYCPGWRFSISQLCSKGFGKDVFAVGFYGCFQSFCYFHMDLYPVRNIQVCGFAKILHPADEFPRQAFTDKLWVLIR